MPTRWAPLPLALLLALLAALPAAAQPQPQPPRATPPPRARAVQTMTLDSAAWPDGGVIPLKHSQAGRDVSPPLSWSGAPEGVVSYVLVVRDLDAVATATGDDTLHWLVWNIPGTATALPEGVPAGHAPLAPTPPAAPPLAPPDGLRQISATGPGYRGPAAPASGPPHHYVFELFALDSRVEVPAVGQSPAATRAAVMAAMAGHVRGKGVRIGLFRRPAP
jgi:Raf kinase inhibitor-like YbhB/YbcL family protein